MTTRDRDPSPEKTGASTYAYYVLFALGLVNMLNYVDRHILSILLQPVKQEFGVSDEWMGILTGMAFVLVHSLFGIPIARLADRTSRKAVIAMGVAIWSALTALSGAAQAFWQLLVLRMGVGIGEAAGAPPSHAMISDYFEPARRATALSIYSMGVFAGIMFGYFAAGWIGEHFGWRLTFVAVGLPGLALALLVHTTVREPPRADAGVEEPVREVFRYLFGKPAFAALMLAASFHAVTSYAAVIWTPTLFLRLHGMSLSEIGVWLGLISGLGGAVGTLAGGTLADRLGRRDPRWYAWVAALAAFAAVPCAFLYLRAESGTVALAAYLPFIVLIGMYNGPLHAMNQWLAKPRMRAMSVAIQLLIVNIVGGGIGPWIVGRMNDSLHAELGDAAIRTSMMLSLGTCAFFAGTLYLVTGVFLRRGIADTEEH
jgi:predicted MFS family arabinose efflux permease